MRVAIADDSGLFRQSLARSLVEVGLDVRGAYATTAELIAVVAREHVDVAVIDVYFRGRSDGLEAASMIREHHPDVGVLLLSAQTVTRQAIDLLRRFDRSVGYLQKDHVADIEELRSAIRRVGEGDCVVDAEIVRRLLNAPASQSGLDRLSGQERMVLDLMARGYSNRGIAAEAHLSERTVEGHIGQIFTKLGIDPASGGVTTHQNRRVLAVITWLRATDV